MTLPLRTDLLIDFLEKRGWRRSRTGQRIDEFEPPENLGLPEDYRLIVPHIGAAGGLQIALLRIVDVLADIYDMSIDQLCAMLAARGVVFSLHLENEHATSASFSFVNFERVIDKVKQTLLHTATFVLDKSPTIQTVPEPAQAYLQRCRFLHTEVGSFVAKIQLPSGQNLSSRTGAVQSDDVNTRLSDILAFVSDRVLDETDMNIFTEAGLEVSKDLINIDVLKDVQELFERSGVRSIRFGFDSVLSSREVSSGHLSRQRLLRLDEYIKFAKERLAGDLRMDAIGRIIELHAPTADRRTNHVLIRAMVNQRTEVIAVRLQPAQYAVAVSAHERNRPVRVRGTFQRQRSRLKVTRVVSFEELPPERPFDA